MMVGRRPTASVPKAPKAQPTSEPEAITSV